MLTGVNPIQDAGFQIPGDRAIHFDEAFDTELDFEADLRAQDAWRESQLMQETGGLGSMAKGVMRPGGRHTIVCKHWLRDLCMKGDKCDFLHQYDLARMPECTQWARLGRCIDQECDFRHDTEKIECQKFKFGFCKLGGQCKMRHERHTRPYLPETIPDWYLKELVPNIFEFVPKLPEETVRVTNLEDPLFGIQHPTHPITNESWNIPPESASGAVPQDAWAVPAVPQWPAPVFRNIAPAPREQRRIGGPQRNHQVDDRGYHSRKAPVPEIKESRTQSPQTLGQERSRPEGRNIVRRREDTRPSPLADDRQRTRGDDRRVDERSDRRREERRYSPDRKTERNPDRRNSPPRDDGRRRREDFVDRQPITRGSSPSSRRDRRDDIRDDRRRRRSRSRSNERRRDDRYKGSRR